MGRLSEIIGEGIFPSGIYCICCGSMIDRTRNYSVCDDCMKRIHWINGRSCAVCGKALPDTFRGEICYDCMVCPHDFDRGWSCMTYGLLERRMIMDFKYYGRSYMGRHFGDILYDRIEVENISPDGIIAVPIHGKRLRKRGYNQSLLMAERLSERWGVPVMRDVLVKVKDTSFLRKMDPVEREEELAGAFEAREDLKGGTVLLVDDIYTTGSTADACSRELKKSGAGAVLLLTLASGGNRKPGK